MKKIISFLAALGLSACLTVTALAGSVQVTQLPSAETVITIRGVYVEAPPRQLELIVGDPDRDHVTLPDGSTLRVEGGDSDQGLRVVLIPVTQQDEPDAYTWASGAAAKAGRTPVIYYLAFFRGDAPATPSGQLRVTATVPEGYEKGRLHYLSCEGQLTRLRPSWSGKTAAFSAGEAGYFVFTKAAAASRPGQTGDGVGDSAAGAGDAQSPKTADAFQPVLWGGLLLAAAAALTVQRRRTMRG